jgi:hypothetical protein
VLQAVSLLKHGVQVGVLSSRRVVALVFVPEPANKRKITITPASRTQIGPLMFCRNIAQHLLDRRRYGKIRRHAFLVDYTTTIKAPPISGTPYLFVLFVFALYEGKNEKHKMRSTMLPSILSLPALSLSKGRRAGFEHRYGNAK